MLNQTHADSGIPRPESRLPGFGIRFPVCVMDARDDRQIDRQALWGATEPGVGGPVARAVGFDLPKAAVAGLSAGWFTGRAVAKERVPRIRALAKQEKAEIYFEDESGVRSDFHSGSTWAARARRRSCASRANASV